MAVMAPTLEMRCFTYCMIASRTILFNPSYPNEKAKYKNRSAVDNNETEIGTIWTYMQNGEQQKNKKCDVGNYGWEGKTWKTYHVVDR